MFDGFWYGIFGGFFGPGIAQWMSRFKYWVIFLVAVVGTYIGLFAAGIYAKGLKHATQIMLANILSPDVIFISIGAGIFAVIVAFLGSLSTSQKPIKSDKNNP